MKTFLPLINPYHGVLRLNGRELQTVLHASGGTVALCPAVQASAAKLAVCLIFSGPLRRLGSGWGIAPLLLGDVGFWSVHCLHMLPERAGVGVALGAAGDLAHVRFLSRGKITVGFNHCSVQ